MKEMGTFKLSDGRVVLASRTKKENFYPVTYANMRQAEKKRDAMGEGWCITGNRPYYVTKYNTIPLVDVSGIPPTYALDEVREMIEYGVNYHLSTFQIDHGPSYIMQSDLSISVRIGTKYYKIVVTEDK